MKPISLSAVETVPSPPMLRVSFDGCNDCHVTTTVTGDEHPDDVTLKVEFCPLHEAARDLLNACRSARIATWEHDNAPTERSDYPAYPACGVAFPLTCDLLDAAIAKAEQGKARRTA